MAHLTNSIKKKDIKLEMWYLPRSFNKINNFILEGGHCVEFEKHMQARLHRENPYIHPYQMIKSAPFPVRIHSHVIKTRLPSVYIFWNKGLTLFGAFWNMHGSKKKSIMNASYNAFPVFGVVGFSFRSAMKRKHSPKIHLCYCGNGQDSGVINSTKSAQNQESAWRTFVKALSFQVLMW